MKREYKRIDVSLSPQEKQMVAWMANRDAVTPDEEMRIIFHTELYNLMELHMEEMLAESNYNAEPFSYKKP